MKAMKKILGTMIVSAMVTSVAGAADVFVEEVAVAPAPAPAPASAWDGLFVGVHAGYGWTDTTVSRTVGPPANVFSSSQISPNGVLGGFQAGYNYQHNNLVFGVVGDIALTGMQETGVVPAGQFVTFETEYDWLATIRGRAGWLFNDNVLIYGHGGLAIADVSTDFTAANPASAINGVSLGGTEVGWVAGAGVEAAVADRVTVFAEYSYIDLNSNDSFSFNPPGPPAVATFSADNDAINSVKVGVNFKLWSPGN
ncbi:outer membrane protein [Hoeflea prorocentri]|uniref:Outer membrane beta-barrel protein n=1 Tax=Hoeflea prorocentri TaxID=1922333 RepID=A0A9X3UEU8_9HYPH|nr:outer membrane beta-barrel protein [Hoeflea prorocentri]MCY6380012.1 outer membrane beta-barrel protein [Hoeflea prorocentri]MDA5397812.1 outer membrane beta-barrel protein [Hoeflea prorocentri]